MTDEQDRPLETEEGDWTKVAGSAVSFDRIPPNDLQAEQAVLGAILLKPSSMSQVVSLLGSHDNPFYCPAHGYIYEALLALYEDGSAIDAILLKDKLGSKLEDSGGLAYIADLTSVVPTAANVEHYAEVVLQKSIFRDALMACVRFNADYSVPPARAIIEMSHAMETLARAVITDSMVPRMAKQLTPKFVEYMEQLHSGVYKPKSFSGIECLDKLIGGFEAGDIVIVAGRPGMGKTALALNVSCNTLKQHGSVLFFSFEMTERQIMTRMAGCWGQIAVRDIRGFYGAETLEKIRCFADEVSQEPFYVARSMKPTIEALEPVLSQHTAKYGAPDLVVVDYLQLMSSTRKFNTRNDELAYISRTLKGLADEIGAPIMVLSQLVRPPKESKDRRPQLHHLRDSGAIESDADEVILLGFNSAHENGNVMILDLDVAKNRMGTAGSCQVRFVMDIQHIQDVAWSADEEPEPKKELSGSSEDLPF